MGVLHPVNTIERVSRVYKLHQYRRILTETDEESLVSLYSEVAKRCSKSGNDPSESIEKAISERTFWRAEIVGLRGRLILQIAIPPEKARLSCVQLEPHRIALQLQ